MTLIACQPAPSIQRTLRGLQPEYQALLEERFRRLLPILLRLMRPRDILERNRAWPGVRPIGQGATRFLSLKPSRRAHKLIKTHAAKHSEDQEALWHLFRAYCRYGPIGLLEALPSELEPLIPDELQECANFYRLAKHPRSDAGMHIRELLNEYADELGYPRLPAFVARYAFASNRRIERWYVGEHIRTEHISKTTRRLNLDQSYEHQRWTLKIAPLPLECQLSERHLVSVQPWLCWTIDCFTSTLMGVIICPREPTTEDALLCLRWSIWHYDAPWWKARGIPDKLTFPVHLAKLSAKGERTLRYLRCKVTGEEQLDDASWLGFPPNFETWLHSLMPTTSSLPRLSIDDLRKHLLDYLRDESSGVAAVASPGFLLERGVSLPWGVGIAATLLLPSAGNQTVHKGKVWPFGVPFDVAACDLADGQLVDVRYDPHDARRVYLISKGAHICLAPAIGFEHKTSWLDLVADPSVLLK